MTRHLLSESNNGSSLVVEDGDVVVIALPELATAGYQWQAERVPDGIDVTFQPLASASDVAGATSHVEVVATVRASAAGELVLRLRQPWSPEELDRSFRVSLLRE